MEQVCPDPKLVKKALPVHRRLLDLYGEPEWHQPKPALDELVSTILSQNTNDRNRDSAFSQLRKKFNSWEEVRDSDQEEVIGAIRTAGLANQKGPRIQVILKKITAERGELDLEFLRRLPPEKTREWLMGLKGVGPKTAAIVMQFSLAMPAFPVDTHIFRVSGRVGLRPKMINVERAHILMSSIFPPETYAAAHMNMIRLGREVCLPRTPRCPECVLRDICDYYRL